MTRIKIYFLIVLMACLPVASTFVTKSSFGTATALKRKQQHFNTLFLHVDPIHLHRDSLLRLDDPMLVGKATENNMKISKKDIHRFTNTLAPLILAIYLIGFYLSNYYTSPAFVENGEVYMPVDPMFGGYVLIGTGLMMMKWSIERTFLSPP
ncbi:predicted protein [Thalassiosira pseudonana CCMP1335]|jgi:hypothetical protein|uniref:Uncharacterized protein n=1 Tax=Thalassiosira pseudonana TaxID=35128 RepID=B8BY93_THAPS|nr:predicted protein [Thalassiosira pseudonana CCMP1335]EED93848.1 predicted protein [Thalassiosira pseudonana CCMP1335]|mmetsp:Transcript_36/g.92  ORF Transcript_36/g.92 Transcript_36/m.92 type:complete len:152 (+) Transcript_36:153-608(+)|eukprot:scaffold984_cov175-Alexandrium_tamarense.AAC.21